MSSSFLIVKVISLFVASFLVALAIAAILIPLLYKYQAWKKRPREGGLGGGATPIFTKLHGEKEVKTPRMGGILIWATTLIVTLGTYIASQFFPEPLAAKINFFSRSETWLPLFTLVSASVLGLVDDILVVTNRGGYSGGGMRLKVRLMLVSLIALLGAWWFHFKLEWSQFYVPFYGDVEINGWYLLLFVIVVLATFSGGVVDGLDGLSAGVLAPVFLAFGVIAYAQGLYDLTAFIIVVVGALVTYLWFNVHPARFYMGETGIMGLTVTLAIIAFLTNTVLFLPLIALVLVAESLSVIIQVASKKLRNGKKVFLSAPIHHHFEALGWPETQITMRFWIISAIASGLGLVLYFLSRFFVR